MERKEKQKEQAEFTRKEENDANCKVKELKNRQHAYVAGQGGYLGLKESDSTNNNLNRELISAFLKENGRAYLGLVNLPSKKYKKVNEGAAVSIFKEFTGSEPIYNFGADFVIPQEDEKLESLIQEWNTPAGCQGDCLDSIMARIYELGGFTLVWT